jgi:hypothetical protein
MALKYRSHIEGTITEHQYHKEKAMMGVILFLLIVIGWLCGWVLLERKKLDQQEMLLDVQARKRNGRVKPGKFGRWTYPTLLLKYQAYDLTISVIPGGRYPPPYTCAKSSIPLPSHVQCMLLFEKSEMQRLDTNVSMNSV